MPNMPSMAKIAKYWWTDDNAKKVFGSWFPRFYIGCVDEDQCEPYTWETPFCFGCGWRPPVDRTQPREHSWSDVAAYLERAHLVADRFGGSAEPHNLVPLCHECHVSMDKRGKTVTRDEAVRFLRNIDSFDYAHQEVDDLVFLKHKGNVYAALTDLQMNYLQDENSKLFRLEYDKDSIVRLFLTRFLRVLSREEHEIFVEWGKIGENDAYIR